MHLLDHGFWTTQRLLTRHAMLLLWAVVLLVSGCSVAPTATTPGAYTGTGERVLEDGLLALESLANAAYPSLLLEGAQVMLSDGRLHDAERGITFTMLPEPSAHGLIDGAPVAAVLLVESGGGSGAFVSLVLFGIESGRPVTLATILLGDRPRVQHLDIGDNGTVIVQMVQVGANDLFCCPATPMRAEYVYVDGKLLLRELWTATIDAKGYADQTNAFIVQAAPYDRSQPPAGQGQPIHFAWTFGANPDLDLARAHVAGAGYVAVYPVAPYRAVWDHVGDPFVADTLAALNGLLDQRPEDLRAPLPMLPLQNGVNDFAARVAYRRLADGGRGMRFVGRFAQDAAPLRNGQLRYLFQGFSADGSALVVASLPITVAALPDDNEIGLGPAGPGHDIGAHLEHWRVIVDALQPTAFEPALEELDALLQSVTVTAPNPRH
jgi:hypothetical protein